VMTPNKEAMNRDVFDSSAKPAPTMLNSPKPRASGILSHRSARPIQCPGDQDNQGQEEDDHWVMSTGDPKQRLAAQQDIAQSTATKRRD
jgi:hypothetical protein